MIENRRRSIAGSTSSLDEAVSPSSSTTNLGAESVETSQFPVNKLRQFGKFFSTRLAQITIQARCNERIDIKSVGGSHTDWFNLRIEELGEVSAHLKSGIKRFPPDMPFTVEFWLFTADSEVLPLECWTFWIDENSKSSHSVNFYHELSAMLKSVMTAARMTPMFRYYVKKQSADTFVILYKVCEGFSNMDLGADSKELILGCLPSPIGSFKLRLSYRTRMEIERAATHASDSFQQVSYSSNATPGVTPEPVVFMTGSPGSFFEVTSHSSSSPSSAPSSPATSPPNAFLGVAQTPPVCNPAVQNGRIRSSSLSGIGEQSSSSPKERSLIRSQTAPRNMPFSGLLNLSYTGMLCPLMEQDEPHAGRKRTSSECVIETSPHVIVPTLSASCAPISEVLPTQSNEDTEDDEDKDDLKPVARSRVNTLVAQRGNDSMASSQATMVCSRKTPSDGIETTNSVVERVVEEKAEEVEEHNEPYETTEEDDKVFDNAVGSKSGDCTVFERRDSDDDDSFVKIPSFGKLKDDELFSNAQLDTEAQLTELITACKASPSLYEEQVNLLTLSQQLSEYSRNQGIFDRFVNELKEVSDRMSE